MSLTEIKAALDDAIARAVIVKVERAFPADPRLHGYVLARSDRLVLLHTFHDFRYDGWFIVRVEDIDDVECDSDTGRFYDGIHRAEGLLPRRGPPFAINLWTLQTAFKALLPNTRLVTIECETSDDDDDFVLGHIMAVDDDAVTVRPMDALGKWMEVERVALAAITKVGLETPYLQMFVKHGDPPPPAATE